MDKKVFFVLLIVISLSLPSPAKSNSQEDDLYKSVHFPVQITSHIGEDFYPAISKDGDDLAFVSDRSGNLDIWIQSLEKDKSNLPLQITSHSADDSSPAWSPNGNLIAFVSMRNDPKGDIYIVDLGEKDESKRFQRLTENDSFDSAPAWSPDGKHIAYASRKSGEIIDNIRLVNIETGMNKSLKTPGGSNPAYSPDGLYIAFITGNKGAWGNISVLRLSDNEIFPLTSGNEMDGFPSWSSDGKVIYFSRFSDDTNLDRSISIEDMSNIWSIEFNDKKSIDKKFKPGIRQLTSSKTYDLYPHVSSNNFLYYTSIRKGNIDIWRSSPFGLLSKQISLEKSILLAKNICSDFSFSPYDCQLSYRNAIQDHSTSPEIKSLAKIQYNIAKSYQSLKNYPHAKDEYLKLQLTYPEILKYQGLSLIELETIAIEESKKNNSLAEAGPQSIQKLSSIINEYQNISSVAARAYLEIGNIYIDLKDSLKALQNYQKVIEQFPGEREIAAAAAFNKNKLYLGFKNRDKLTNVFLGVLKKYPDQVYWGKKAADAIINLFKDEEEPLKERINSLRKLIKQFQDIPILPARAQNKIGLLFYLNNENLLAKKEYRNVTTLFPDEKDESTSALFSLAKIYFEEREYESSLKIYRELEQNTFDRMEVFKKARKEFIKSSLDKGSKEFNEGEIGLALKTYRKLIDYDRSIVEAHRGLIRCYAALDKTKKIVAEYRKKSLEFPENSIELYSHGLALTYMKEIPIDEAAKLVKRSINIDSQIPYFHQTLGWLYEQKENEDERGVFLEQAMEEYQTALALNDETEHPVNEANLLLNYGNASFKLQNIATAYKFYHQRLKTKIPFENPKREMLFYQRFGQAAFRQGEYSDAATYFHKALKLAIKENNLHRQAEINDRLALSYQEQGYYDEAVKYFSHTLSLNKKLGNVKSLSITLRNIANNLYSLGESETGPQKTDKLSRALKFYNESIETLGEYGVKEAKKRKKRGLLSFEFETKIGADASQAARGFDKVGEEKLIFNYLGKIYSDLHDYERAISYLIKKLDLTPADLPLEGNIPVLTEKAIILNQVGALYYRKNNIIKSLDYFIKSYNLCIKLKNSHGIAVNSANLGKILVEQLQKYPDKTGILPLKTIQSHTTLLTKALEYLTKGKPINEPLYIVLLKNSLAILYFQFAMEEKTIPSLNDSKKDGSYDLIKKSVLSGLEMIAQESHYLKKSQNLLKSAHTFLEKNKSAIKGETYFISSAILNYNLGILKPYVVKAKEGGGKKNIAAPLKKERIIVDINRLADERNLLDLQWKIRFLDSFSSTKESGIKKLKEAVEILENIPFDFYSNEDSQSELLMQRLYNRLVFLLMQNGNKEESLQYLERKKGMELVSQLDGKRIPFEDHTRGEYSHRIHKASSELKDLYTKLQAKSLKKTDIADIKNAFEEKQNEYNELMENIMGEDPELALIYKPSAPYIEEVQEILNYDEVVLTYKVVNNHLLKWTITNETFEGNIQFIERENKKLSELLISEKITKYKRVYIINEGGLKNVRWPSLVLKDKKLIEYVQIVHLISLNHLLNTYNKRNLSGEALLYVNNQNSTPFSGSKEGSSDTFANKTESFGRKSQKNNSNIFYSIKNNFRSYLNFQEEENTRSSFLNALNYYGVVQFNNAITLIPSSPLHSFIHLNSNNKGFNRLESWELFALQKEGNLVSLSNIEDIQKRDEVTRQILVKKTSGSSKRFEPSFSEIKQGHKDGDILPSLNFLVQSFSYAGYPSVLVELEKTDKEIRHNFFNKFYTYLTKKSPAESLRLALIDISRNNPGLYLWDHYRLYGYGGMNDEERVVFAESHFNNKIKQGVRFFSEKKWKKAIAAFERALVLSNILQDKQNFYERIYKAITDAAYNINDFEKAIIYENKHVEILEKSDEPDPEKLAEEVYFLGILYSKVENYSASVTHLKRSLDIYKEYGILDKLAEGFSTLGKVKEKSSDYSEALKAFTSSLKLQRDLGESIEEGKELRRIGRIYYQWLNKYTIAEKYFRKALKVFESEEQTQQVIQTMLEIGLTREKVGDFTGSLKYYNKANTLAKNTGDKEGLTLAPLYIANSYWFQADYQNAFENIRMALKMAKNIQNERFQVFAYNTLGLIYWTLNDLVQAKDNLRKSLALAKKIDSRLDIASAYNNLGLIYRQEKKYEKSIDHFKEALAIDEIIKTKWGKGYDHRNIGMSYLRLKDFEKAKLNIEIAVNLSGEIGNRINEAKSMLEMGNLHLETGKYKKAVYYFKNTYSLSENINLPEVLWRALRGEGKAYWKAGDKENALSKYRKAIDVVEKLRASIKLEEFKNGFIENKQDLYQEIILLLLELGLNEEAFNYSERARGRSFIDLLGNHKLVLKNPSDQNLFINVQNLKQQIHETKEALIEAKNVEHFELKEKLTKLNNQLQDLLFELKKNNPELSSFVTVDPMKLEEIYTILDKDVALIEYLVTEKEVIAWVLHNNNLDLVRTPMIKSKLISLVKKFRNSMEELMPMDEISRELYNILIKPVEPYLKARYIGIIPHGSLHYLSFASLRDDSAYFIERHPIFYSPSASTLKYTFERRRKEKNVKVLAIGNPDLGNLNYDLPLSEMEANSIKWNFKNIDILTRGEAKESWLVNNISNYGIIHIASHGEFDDINPLFSSLKLVRDITADGNLEVNEIFSLDIKADLITLSACQTGLGKITGGDEIVGLNRSFFYAGTHSIISSLWRISDISTAILIKHFYRNYKTYNKAEALRKAQLFVKKLYPHPSFWSGLTLTGDYK